MLVDARTFAYTAAFSREHLHLGMVMFRSIGLLLMKAWTRKHSMRHLHLQVCIIKVQAGGEHNSAMQVSYRVNGSGG